MIKEGWTNFSEFSSQKPYDGFHISRSSNPHVLLGKSVGTFMNLSGPPVARAWKTFKRANPESSLVILHDELQIPLGKIQIRRRGTSARGHNGLRSIDSVMGNDYTKIGIGVGKPAKQSVADFVTSKFTVSEQDILDSKVLPMIYEAMEAMVNGKHIHERFSG